MRFDDNNFDSTKCGAASWPAYKGTDFSFNYRSGFSPVYYAIGFGEFARISGAAGVGLVFGFDFTSDVAWYLFLNQFIAECDQAVGEFGCGFLRADV